MRKLVYFNDIEVEEIEPSVEVPDFSLPEQPISFSVLGEQPAGYGNPPLVKMQISVPASDMPRVAAWFSGDYHGVTEPESEQLLRNITVSVRNLLSAYFSACSSANLFAAPFLIGWRYRLFDGSVAMPEAPVVIAPNATAPLLEITGHNLGEKTLVTDVKVHSAPGRLRVAAQPVGNMEAFKGLISSVEIVVAKPAALYSPQCSAGAPGNVDIDGSRRLCWWYERYSSEAVDAAARASTPLRILETIPFSEFAYGFGERDVRLAPGALAEFAGFPEAEETGTSVWRPYLAVTTEPLDLGDPERAKRVRGVTLRGIFDRSSVRMRLFGAHHRGMDWRLLAETDTPYIRGLRGNAFRWLRVEVEMNRNPEDFLDYLCFLYK